MIVSGDLHLRPRTWASRRDLAGDAYFGLSQLVDMALRRLDDLLLLGDIFDESRPDAASVNFFSAQISRLAPAGLRCFIIRGNHDLCPVVVDGVSSVWGASAGFPIGGQLLFSLSSSRINHHAIFGIDACGRNELKRALQSVPPEATMIAAHQSWDQLQGVGDTTGRLADIPAHIQVLLTGDLHQHRAERFGNLLVVSPGSTCMQAINESPEKSCFRMLAPDGVVGLESHPLATRPFLSAAVRTPRDLDEVADRCRSAADVAAGILPEELRRPLVRVSHPRSAAIYERLQELSADGLGHFFSQLLPAEDSRQTSVELGDRRFRHSFVDLARMQCGANAELLADVMRLHDAGDGWAAELDQMEREAGCA